MMTFNYCRVCLLFTLCLPLLACRLLELFFLVKFVAKFVLDSLFRFAWRCDIFPAGFVTSFAEDFLLFSRFFSRKQYPSFYSDKLLERDTQHHIFTFPQFSVAGYFDELLLPVHWQFELVPCSHTGMPRFKNFSRNWIGKTVDHELLLPNWFCFSYISV
jgi:hypothetical protein